MRATLINSADKTVKEVDYDGNFESIYTHIDCTTFAVPFTLENEDALFFLGGISDTKLRDLKIPRRCLGRRRLYDRRDLEAFVDSLAYDNEEAQIDDGEEWLQENG